MASAIIIDDEKKSRLNLETLLKRHCPQVTVAGLAGNIREGEELILKENPDLVFLDVEMPEGDGFKLLEIIENTEFEVIFTTAHIDYAVKAIRSSATDYLMKPIDISELKNAVEKALKNVDRKNNMNASSLETLLIKSRNNPEILAIPTVEGLQFISVKNIIRCSADINYTVFFLDNSTSIVVAKTLKEYEDLLGELNFIRVHQSHLVNILHVKKYVRGDGGYLIMSDQSTVEVSRRKKTEFLEKLFS